MELETLFTDQKWNILSSLSKGKYSPLQLANMHKTTIANISQQLRLLEAANLVKKEKIPNRDKGKPRTLFSLSHDYSYMISAMGNFAKKRLIKLNDYHKSILRIWFIDDIEMHYYIEKFYWKIEPYFDLIVAVAVNINKKDIDFLIFTENIQKLRNKITSQKIKKENKEYANIKVKLFSDKDIRKQTLDSFKNLFIIYDKNKLLSLLNKKEVVS